MNYEKVEKNLDENTFIFDFRLKFVSEFASDYINEKSMKLILFQIFVQNLRQNLNQITSMKNRWNWLYFIVLFKLCVKFCVKLHQWKIDEIDCISIFRSEFASDFASDFHNSKSIKLILFYFFVKNLRQILSQNFAMQNRSLIDNQSLLTQN